MIEHKEAVVVLLISVIFAVPLGLMIIQIVRQEVSEWRDCRLEKKLRDWVRR